MVLTKVINLFQYFSCDSFKFTEHSIRRCFTSSINFLRFYKFLLLGATDNKEHRFWWFSKPMQVKIEEWTINQN